MQDIADDRKDVFGMIAISFKMKRMWWILPAAIVLIVGVALIFTIRQPENGKTPEQLLEQYGWQAEFKQQQDICIPGSFSNEYEEYNDLQKRQGFNLKRFAGKPCTLMRYEILNADQEDLVADFIVYDNKVIGGDLHQQKYGESYRPLNGDT